MPATARLSPRQLTILKIGLFLLSLMPILAAIYRLFSDNPPINPVEFLTLESGEQALRFLVITLAMTPLQTVSGWHTPIKLRRMFGLFAFFYAACHFGIYLVLDLQLDFSQVWDDIVKRKYITVGAAALLLMLPLAATSNRFAIRRLGAAAWTTLHRAVYPIGILGAVHFLWIKRAQNIGEPMIYLLLICVLLALRLPAIKNKIRRRR